MLKRPPREGPRPKTTPCAPHTQISQNPDARFHRAFKDRAFDFPFVTRQPSMISVPGAEALCLKHGHGRGCRKAFMIGNEFAHVHPPEDGSLHMMLPEEAVPQIVDLGWAEPHPMAAAGMIRQPQLWSTAPETRWRSKRFSNSCACLMTLPVASSGGSTASFFDGKNRAALAKIDRRSACADGPFDLLVAGASVGSQ